MTEKCINCGTELMSITEDYTHSNILGGLLCYDCLHEYPNSENATLKTPKITELENDVIMNGIAKSDFFDDYTNDPVWSDLLIDDCEITTSPQLPGVVSSLVKKGMITQTGKGKGASVQLTAEGFWYFLSKE